MSRRPPTHLSAAVGKTHQNSSKKCIQSPQTAPSRRLPGAIRSSLHVPRTRYQWPNPTLGRRGRRRTRSGRSQNSRMVQGPKVKIFHRSPRSHQRGIPVTWPVEWIPRDPTPTATQQHRGVGPARGPTRSMNQSSPKSTKKSIKNACVRTIITYSRGHLKIARPDKDSISKVNPNCQGLGCHRTRTESSKTQGVAPSNNQLSNHGSRSHRQWAVGPATSARPK